MSQPPRRQKGGYFNAEADSPRPVVVRLKYRVRFSDADAMGVLWHGRYAQLFEMANEEIGRQCGLTYAEFYRERVAAPIVQLHVDYFAPARLEEELQIIGKMVWSGSARMNIEYEILKSEGSLAASGFTVQMFVDEHGTPLLASPSLLEKCQSRWRAGEFA